MRLVFAFLGILLLIVNLSASGQQQNDGACGFALQGQPTQPTVAGPDDITPLVYVVEQPDSPIEFVSVDLTGMWLSVSNEQVTEHFCAKYQVRNRSDRNVQRFEIMLMLSTMGGADGGSGAISSSTLQPGQTVMVESCNGGGSGGAKDNYVRLLVYVDRIDFEDCHYKPSLRLPRSLNVNPAW